MRPSVIVFARTPRRGAVKRRLAATIGAAAALRFHRLALERLIRRLARDRRWRTVLCVTAGSYRWPRAVPRIAQARGGLGRRMARAIAVMPPGPALLIGSDIPEIRPAHIAGAFRALAGCDVVLGPASDGGYWLVGLRDRGLLGRLFEGVRWSTPHALADTRANLPAGRRVALIETLSDIDDETAWRHLVVSHRR
ncbi:MAG: TIGR04282 family arsenosugar biosynthesis glycosyltransferase [Rhodospirillales bacterium]|nr:MAG: TIGR04282 family arsenosugar biosynthesis glycosyltransferase [Rhodospirillales bacterium]